MPSCIPDGLCTQPPSSTPGSLMTLPHAPTKLLLRQASRAPRYQQLLHPPASFQTPLPPPPLTSNASSSPIPHAPRSLLKATLSPSLPLPVKTLCCPCTRPFLSALWFLRCGSQSDLFKNTNLAVAPRCLKLVRGF